MAYRHSSGKILVCKKSIDKIFRIIKNESCPYLNQVAAVLNLAPIKQTWLSAPENSQRDLSQVYVHTFRLVSTYFFVKSG